MLRQRQPDEPAAHGHPRRRGHHRAALIDLDVVGREEPLRRRLVEVRLTEGPDAGRVACSTFASPVASIAPAIPCFTLTGPRAATTPAMPRPTSTVWPRTRPIRRPRTSVVPCGSPCASCPPASYPAPFVSIVLPSSSQGRRSRPGRWSAPPEAPPPFRHIVRTTAAASSKATLASSAAAATLA